MQPTRHDASFTLTDPIVTEIIQHQLLGVAEDMNITMRRTTRSVIAKETNDFSAALLDGSGRPIMLAMPYGLRAFAHAGPRTVAKWRGRFRPGDVIISNDPYQGTSHLPDIVAVMPIFSGNDVVAFSATYQHHTDMGGRFPGGYGTASRELYEEGLRLPIVSFYTAGEPNTSVHEIIGANVRSPEDVLGDLEANSAACRRGSAGMTALFAEHGVQTVLAAASHFVRTSESFLARRHRSHPRRGVTGRREPSMTGGTCTSIWSSRRSSRATT